MPQNQSVRFIEDTLRTVLRAVLAVFLSAPIAGLITAGVVEAIGSLSTHLFPAPTPIHLLALVFALVVGYAVALTYAVVESVIGATRIAKMLERDVLQEGSMIERGIKGLERSITGR